MWAGSLNESISGKDFDGYQTICIVPGHSCFTCAWLEWWLKDGMKKNNTCAWIPEEYKPQSFFFEIDALPDGCFNLSLDSQVFDFF